MTMARYAALSGVAALWLASCGGTHATGPAGTDGGVTVTPVIDGLADRVPLGTPVSLSVQAPEGIPASASYQWSADCGTFASTTDAVVEWTAPDAATPCEITVALSWSGGGGTATASTRATNAVTLVGSDATGDGTAAGFDVTDYYYGVVDGTLYVEVDLAEFDPGSAQVEIFLLQVTPDQDIYSLGLKAGATMFFWANRPAGHPHYHWVEEAAPASLTITATSSTLSASVALSDVGLGTQTQARTGVAGAPMVVAQTASYTDRLPDGLLVTATDVEGLPTVNLQ